MYLDIHLNTNIQQRDAQAMSDQRNMDGEEKTLYGIKSVVDHYNGGAFSPSREGDFSKEGSELDIRPLQEYSSAGELRRRPEHYSSFFQELLAGGEVLVHNLQSEQPRQVREKRSSLIGKRGSDINKEVYVTAKEVVANKKNKSSLSPPTPHTIYDEF